MTTLGALLDQAAERAPTREALAVAPYDAVTARLTWRELRAASRAAAKRLVAAGVTKGAHVGFLCSNRLEWLPVAFGALRIGAVLVPFSTLWKRDEIAYALRHADVSLLVTLPGFRKLDYLASLKEIVPALAHARPGALFAPEVPALRSVVVLEGVSPAGCTRWSDLPADVDDGFLDALEATVTPADRATIFFTSGTTSQAKAVVHAHGGLTTSARATNACLGVGPFTRISPGSPAGSVRPVSGSVTRTSVPASARPKVPRRTGSGSSQRAQVTQVAVSLMPYMPTASWSAPRRRDASAW